MGDRAAIDALVSSILTEFGRIDVLVNNAGITNDQLFIRMKDEDWTNVMNVNLNALFYLTQPVVKAMSKQKGGAIINMSSVVGLHGNPAQVNYATTKAGILGFSKSIAKEYGRRGIRVNVIAPGFIQTEMTDKLPEEIQNKYKENIPLGDFGSAKDVADAALFLAASSNYITGQVIQVDGGLFM
jgi:3-oxoacyl-[acyl-carrier protein] reductase